MYVGFVESLKAKYEGQVDVVIYRGGKDFGYIKKYGMTTRSLLIINASKVIKKIDRSTITAAFEEAISLCC